MPLERETTPLYRLETTTEYQEIPHQQAICDVISSNCGPASPIKPNKTQQMVLGKIEKTVNPSLYW